jgi:tRNA threonylcarbamoyl adenosine modification protein (Sua5/YciO/YrdC/YwlC family)
VLDLCTGSGCVALSLLKEAGETHPVVVATDISQEAVNLARENALELGISLNDQLTVFVDDLASSLVADPAAHASFDVVVSNPPYIPTALLAELPREVADHEPALALDGGADGLGLFRRILDQAGALLRPGGMLACELHEDSLTVAAEACKAHGLWFGVGIRRDLTGRERFIVACRRGVVKADWHASRWLCPAVEALKAGEAVVFPTDTVYGLGVAVTASGNAHKVFKLKGRDREKPVAWLVESTEAIARYAADISHKALDLAAAYLPGALTLVLKAGRDVPEGFAAADGTIALRVPDHPVALAVLAELRVPIAASSANLQGQPPALSVESLDAAIAAKAAVVVDAGAVPGVPSTILSCVGDDPTLLRAGAGGPKEYRAASNERQRKDDEESAMTISIASDHAGFEQKAALANHLRKHGHTVVDLGPYDSGRVDYPDVAQKVAQEVAASDGGIGVLVCGTGIGMAMAANKIAGARAANVTSPELAEMARRHNDANILTLSGRFVSLEENCRILDAFLAASFEGGRHTQRLNKLKQLEGSR